MNQSTTQPDSESANFHLLLYGIIIGAFTTGCSPGPGGVDVWKAVEKDDGRAIRSYKAAGGDVNVVAWLDGTTPLWYALEGKKRYAYETLLDCGADPNYVMRGRRAVPHWAALESDSWWLRLALEHGADPNLINVGRGVPRETNPFMFAITKEGTLDNVKLLIDHGFDVNKPDKLDSHPITAAFAFGRYDATLHMLNRGIDYNDKTYGGITLLQYVKMAFDHPEDYKIPSHRDQIAEIHKWLEVDGVDFGSIHIGVGSG